MISFFSIWGLLVEVPEDMAIAVDTHKHDHDHDHDAKKLDDKPVATQKLAEDIDISKQEAEIAVVEEVDEDEVKENQGLISLEEKPVDANGEQAEERPKAIHPADPDITWQSIMLNVDFILVCSCFCLIGMLRDGFFVWLNQYLQVKFNVQIGSAEQLLAFSRFVYEWL